MKKYENIVSDIEFVLDEFWADPIKDGPLKGEPNPTLAIAKIIEIAECVKVYRNQQ